MQETIIQLGEVDPREIFGADLSLFKEITKHFPKIKFITRGDLIKARGNKSELERFEDKFKLIVKYFNKYHKLNEHVIEKLMEDEPEKHLKSDLNDVIVFAAGGKPVKPLTPHQHKMVESVNKTDLVFAVGPAGTGKTYVAVALAVRALRNKEVKRIILTRPAVETGEHLGFLPGDLKEKLDPYLQPLYDALRDLINPEKLNEYTEKGIIQIAPLAFMRGRTLDNAFVILDEAQNATEKQMKMFLTRMGKTSKFIINGDVSQIDLPANKPSGLVQALRALENVEGVSTIFLDETDVVRHPLVKKIIAAYKKDEKVTQKQKDK
ncbi:MAG: PhoH family protein [Bacteroidetes bacterium]|nr:MAG: PhoH family protein [Bacteroidota bacterium]